MKVGRKYFWKNENAKRIRCTRSVIEIIVISINGGHLMIRLFDVYTIILIGGCISSQKL